MCLEYKIEKLTHWNDSIHNVTPSEATYNNYYTYSLHTVIISCGVTVKSLLNVGAVNAKLSHFTW